MPEEKVKRADIDYAQWTEVERVIFNRRSVRNYRKQQVPEFMVRRILEAGRFAPSAGNCQPWKFTVIRDPQMIEEMTASVQKLCAKMSVFDFRKRPYLLPLLKLLIRLDTNKLHPTPMGAISLIGEERLGLFHGAPTVILICKDVRGVSNPDLDVGIAGTNMVLTAHSLGLGTCWVGFCTLLAASSKWRKKLNLKYPYKLIASLAVGYPQGEPDGMVTREKHLIEWYETDGTYKVVS